MDNLTSAIAKALKSQYPTQSPHMVNFKHLNTYNNSSNYEEMLAYQLNSSEMPFVREHRFDPDRRFRLDFAMLPIEMKLGVEIHGDLFGRIVECDKCHGKVQRVLKDGRAVFVREGGRHTTGTGLQNDMDKSNCATLLGWRVLLFTSFQVKDGSALELIKKMMIMEGNRSL